MSILVQSIAGQLLSASLPWWYYDIRIGWLGMTYIDRISMRWLDVLILAGLAVCGLVFFRQSRVTGDWPISRVFRVAMLVALMLTAFLTVAVIFTFALVPYVPAHFPPATPATWISLALDTAAPFTTCAVSLSLLATLIYGLSSGSRIAEPLSSPGDQ